MTEHDGADAQDAPEVAARPDEGPDDQRCATDDAQATSQATSPAAARPERAWAKDLWLSMSRRDLDALPRSARA